MLLMLLPCGTWPVRVSLLLSMPKGAVLALQAACQVHSGLPLAKTFLLERVMARCSRQFHEASFIRVDAYFYLGFSETLSLPTLPDEGLDQQKEILMSRDTLKEAMAAVDAEDAAAGVVDPDAGAPKAPLRPPVIKSKEQLSRESDAKDELTVIAVNGIMEAFSRITKTAQMTKGMLRLFNHAQNEVHTHYDTALIIREAKGDA